MRKKKTFFGLISALFLTGLLTGCDEFDGLKSSNSVDEIQIIYKAYQENGGELTYEEWLASIKGEKGTNGSSILTGKGEPSANLGSEGDSYIDIDTFDYYAKTESGWVKIGNIKGDNGENGNDGVSVESITKTSSNGNIDTYTITYSDGNKSTFTVTNGTDGPQGIQGEKGEDGHAPAITIGDNGNWFIDGVDSGIFAKGMKGEKGENGSSLLSGSGTPSTDLGTDGDSYIDTDTFDYYFKNDGVWTKQGNLKGSDGENGLSIVNTYIDDDGHLICEMSDGSKKDAGKIKDTSKHVVNFYHKDKLLDTIQVIDGAKISAPSREKTKGYRISYWETFNDGFDLGVPWSFDGCIVTSDLNLYMNGDAISFNITYNNVDAGSNLYPRSYTVEDSVTLPSPNKDGYSFEGWYTDSSLENEIVEITEGSTGNLELYAKWTTNKYALTLTSDDTSKGSAEIISGEGYTDEDITIKATPNDGYIFKGWYDEEGRVSASESYIFKMPARDCSLTAKFWTEEEEENAELLGIIPVLSSDQQTLTYGLYPQTHVNDEALISSLNELTVSESTGWHLYDGSYYAKRSAERYASSYTFSDGTKIVEGAEYWFKCEPIEWKILSSSDGTYSLVSNILLDVRVFDNSSNNYANSNIRSWLNEDFYNSAFALSDSIIKTTRVDNSASTLIYDIDTYACEDTDDKVYLLSFKDYLNGDYFYEDGSRYCPITDWAVVNNAMYWSVNDDQSNQHNGYYWMRSPLPTNSSWAMLVYYSANPGSAIAVNANGICVRPALTIKAE